MKRFYKDAGAASVAEIDAIERAHGVQVLYHTHSNRCMGLNAGMLAHLLRGLDPRGVGAYLDTGHLTGEGEEFAVALAMQKEHLSAVSLKDFLLQREVHNGHGRKARNVVEAGQGMTDFTAAFECLHGIGYTGPASIHCEFEVAAAGFEDLEDAVNVVVDLEGQDFVRCRVSGDLVDLGVIGALQEAQAPRDRPERPVMPCEDAPEGGERAAAAGGMGGDCRVHGVVRAVPFLGVTLIWAFRGPDASPEWAALSCGMCKRRKRVVRRTGSALSAAPQGRGTEPLRRGG